MSTIANAKTAMLLRIVQAETSTSAKKWLEIYRALCALSEPVSEAQPEVVTKNPPINYQTSPETCRKKKTHRTMEEARKHGDMFGQFPYQCNVCQLFHVTSIEQATNGNKA